MLKEIQKIRDEYQDPVFRMALEHMIRTGMDHFNEETVAVGKAIARENDAMITAGGGLSIFPIPLQDAILDCAAALAKFEATEIFRFVKHYVQFEGDEKLTKRCKNCDKILRGDDGTLVNDGYEDAFYECDLCHEYSMEDGSVILCDTCGAYYTANHIREGKNEDDDDTCPYCSD